VTAGNTIERSWARLIVTIVIIIVQFAKVINMSQVFNFTGKSDATAGTTRDCKFYSCPEYYANSDWHRGQ